jgi:hypothetical protein
MVTDVLLREMPVGVSAAKVTAAGTKRRKIQEKVKHNTRLMNMTLLISTIPS